MNEILTTLKTIADDSSARAVLVEIAATEGSSPRTAGARMVMTPDGSFSGTVGGGGLEYLALRDARLVLESGEPLRKTYSLGTAPGEATGAVCGGSATLDFRLIGPADAAELLAAQPRPPRVLLFGAGHVGKALADTLHLLGMAVTVTDSRPELLTKARFPHGELVSQPAEDTVPDAAEEDYVVVMTHSHVLDYRLTLQALRSPAHYVGMIGSRSKSALFRARLAEDGIPRAEIDARLHSPIGLPIGAETPEEIAVSIAAELIADLRKN